MDKFKTYIGSNFMKNGIIYINKNRDILKLKGIIYDKHGYNQEIIEYKKG